MRLFAIGAYLIALLAVWLRCLRPRARAASDGARGRGIGGNGLDMRIVIFGGGRFGALTAAALALCAALVGMAGACSSDVAPVAATFTPAATIAVVSEPASPTTAFTSTPYAPTPDIRYTPTPTPALATPVGYDSNRAMYKVFPGFGMTGSRTFEALDEARRYGDRSLVAALVESMRFQSSADARAAAAETLRALTGEAFGGEEWKEWMEWLGRNRAEYPPPDGYLDWKISLMRELDPRFGRFLGPARDGAITVDPTEIVWGGVLPDGIPDLANPPMISAGEADYLAADERVFGVAINGEARAYPLRIVNAHEMVNDSVGGEPIALSW